MRIYIISETTDSNDDFYSLLPVEAEIVRFTDSYSAYKNIKDFKKPCIVLIYFSQISINGDNFIELIRRDCPHVYVYVLCNGHESHLNIDQLFSVDESQIICNEKSCCNNLKKFKSEAILDRINILFSIERTIKDVKTKINSIQRRAEKWERKILIGSS